MKKILLSLFVFGLVFVGAKAFASDPIVNILTEIEGGSVEYKGKIEVRWDTNVVGGAADIYVSDGTHKGEVVRASQKSIVYSLGENLTPGSNYKIYISLADDLSNVKDSSGSFTIGAKAFASDPIVNILTEIEGGSVEYKGKIEVRWDTNVVGGAADIYVSDGTHKGEVVRASQKSIVYSLGENLTPGSNYKIYISLADDLSNVKDSSGSFTIRETGEPSLTVLSPNGGETYKPGDKITVKWETENSENWLINFDLVTLDNDGTHPNTFLITRGQLVNDGREEVTIPKNTPNGSNYMFRIASIDTVASSNNFYDNRVDYSDKTFTISSKDITNTCPSVSKPASTFCPNGTIKAIVDKNQCVTSYRCLEDKPENDKGCLPGYKYNPRTGLVCSDVTINNCLPGYKFDPITGLACSKADDNDDDENDDNKKVCTEPGSNCGVRNHGISRVLKYGLKGDDVKILQEILNLIQDGIFGQETQQRLIEWQAKNGLTPDGIFGQKSRLRAEIGN